LARNPEGFPALGPARPGLSHCPPSHVRSKRDSIDRAARHPPQPGYQRVVPAEQLADAAPAVGQRLNGGFRLGLGMGLGIGPGSSGACTSGIRVGATGTAAGRGPRLPGTRHAAVVRTAVLAARHRLVGNSGHIRRGAERRA
jgi:hypothetical protein